MGAYNDRKLFDVLNGRRNEDSPLFLHSSGMPFFNMLIFSA